MGAPTVTIRFLHGTCDRIAPMREFYTELVGMAEVGHHDEAAFGWVCYQCEGFQLMFFRGDRPLAPHPAWDFMPGDGDERYEGQRLSYGICVPWDDYRARVRRIALRSDVPKMTPRPTWRQGSYWGWSLKDPAHNTLELYAAPPSPHDPAPEWRDA